MLASIGLPASRCERIQRCVLVTSLAAAAIARSAAQIAAPSRAGVAQRSEQRVVCSLRCGIGAAAHLRSSLRGLLAHLPAPPERHDRPESAPRCQPAALSHRGVVLCAAQDVVDRGDQAHVGALGHKLDRDQRGDVRLEPARDVPHESTEHSVRPGVILGCDPTRFRGVSPRAHFVRMRVDVVRGARLSSSSAVRP
eukprot:6796409-Prymnesium_polylepis.2